MGAKSDAAMPNGSGVGVYFSFVDFSDKTLGAVEAGEKKDRFRERLPLSISRSYVMFLSNPFGLQMLRPPVVLPLPCELFMAYC